MRAEVCCHRIDIGRLVFSSYPKHHGCLSYCMCLTETALMLLPCSAISSFVYWKGRRWRWAIIPFTNGCPACLPVWGRSKKQASIENRGDDRRQRPGCLPCPRLGKMCPVYSSLPSGHNSSRTSKDPILHSALAPILAASDGLRLRCH